MNEKRNTLALMFRRAKRENRIVRVVDFYGQVREGRVYRNSSDRANIDMPNRSTPHPECYYSNMVEVELLQPSEVATEYFGDWDNVGYDCTGKWEDAPEKYKDEALARSSTHYQGSTS